MNTKPNLFRWGFTHLYIGTVISLSILLSIAIFGYNSHKKNEESSKSVVHTLQVLNELNALDSMIKEMATNQRGFIITSQPKYERNFHLVAVRINKQLALLEEFVNDNSAQTLRFDQLKVTVLNQHKHQLTNIEMMKDGQKEKVVEKVKTGIGQELNEKVASIIDEIKNEKDRLLEIRLKIDRETSYTTSILILIGSLVTFFIVFFAIVLIRLELKRRLKAQNKYYQSSQIQNAMLQGAGFALIACDKTGGITMFNPAAEKLLGYNQHEMIGRDPSVFHSPAEVVSFAEELSRRFKCKVEAGYETFVFLANRNLIENHKWTYIRRDGTRIPVMLTVTALKNRANEITGYIGIAYDISKQLEFEETLIKARELAMAGNKAKSDFLANMSHEIRTPMNAIMGMAELLQETNLSDEQKKYVDIFRRSGESLLSLINDILDLSKIEAGHFELDSSPFKVSDVVRKSVEIMSLKAHQKNLELAVDIQDSLKDHFIGDGNRIQQILLNLLGNAIKFTKQGEVILRIYPGKPADDKQEVIIEVQDTGIGMNSDQLEKLFERFTQADSSVTKEFGGTGLGLNITKRLSELMGGAVIVESSFGVGSKFTVNIFVNNDDVADNFDTNVSMTDLRILIVDDTKINRMILKKIIENQHAIPFEAENGTLALQMIADQNNKKEPFHLVLLDCRMPGIDGFEVAAKVLKEYSSDAPLLMMLTSDNRPGDLAKSCTLGLKNYLVKPILKQDLLVTISKVMNNKNELPIPTAQPVSEEVHKPLRILLVDDNDENRLVIKAYLKKHPWQIDEGKNGQEGLDHFLGHTYDLVLMDMQMPVMDGYTATREIRKHEENHKLPPTPILALTAYALKEEVDKSILAGCNGHLTKPISKPILISAIVSSTAEVTVTVDKDLEDIVPGYLEGRKTEIEDLFNCLKNNDIKKIQAIGHKLLGSAGSYGFPIMSEFGKRLEDGARTSNLIEIEKTLIDYQMYLKNLKIKFN